MIRGAIFDMDGTLLDSMCVWEQLSQRYLGKFGIHITQADYAALEARTQYQCAQYFCARYPEITETPEEVVQGLDALICSRYAALARPREGAPELLRTLRDSGVQMAVATLTDRKHAEKALADRGLREFFSFLLTIDNVGADKHDPKIYHMAAERMGLPAAACMVFEDAPYAGETAKRAGFQVCGVAEPWYASGRSQLRAVSDVFVEHSFSEVIPVLLHKIRE